MEFAKVVAIDEMGRIHLPRKLREKNDWKMGTQLEVYDMENNTIVLKLHEPPEEPTEN